MTALALEERPRHIFHVNPDDFYAALARQRDPALRARPVIVGHLMNRGSVVSASYEARAAGVHPGMTMQQAARRVPGARLVQIDWAYARYASRTMVRVLERYAPAVERSTLDEAFVDYTGSERSLGPPLDAARRLQHEVTEALGVDVSVGVASNKLVSRFASSSAKRRHLVDVLPGYEASFVAPQPIERLPAIQGAWARRLREMGVATVGALAAFPAELLEVVFGGLGRRLAEAARGIDPSPVVRGVRRPEVCAARTFDPDLLHAADVEAQLDRLCTEFGRELRARGWAVRRFTLELEHADRVRLRRQVVLRAATHLDGYLFDGARMALWRILRRRVRVRRLEVRAQSFEPAPVQLDLFQADPDERLHRLARAADRIADRWGDVNALQRARALVQHAE